MIQKWNFPQQLEEAVRMHHDHPKFADNDPAFCAIVSLANSLCVKLGIGPEKQPDLNLAGLDSAQMLQLDENRLSTISEQLLQQLEEDKTLFCSA